MESQTIHVSIVDDEKLITQLLSNFLQGKPSIKVISTHYDGAELIDFLHETTIAPDVVLLDLKMKQMNGIEASEYLKTNFPDIKIITLSSHYQDANLGYLIKSGANAFLPKEISPAKLIEVIEEVQQKGYYFSVEQINVLRNQISGKIQPPKIDPAEAVSEREKDVLKLICQQMSNQEIADKLFISVRTVEAHRNSLYLKTGTKNLAGLIIYTIKNRLVDINECLLTM